MDPNGTLKELREVMEKLVVLLDGTEREFTSAEGLASEAYDLFLALDGFLARGGFPPDDWMPRGGAA